MKADIQSYLDVLHKSIESHDRLIEYKNMCAQVSSELTKLQEKYPFSP